MLKSFYNDHQIQQRSRCNVSEVAESDEDKPGIIIDYDKDGKIVGIELLDASQRIDNPSSVVYEVA